MNLSDPSLYLQQVLHDMGAAQVITGMAGSRVGEQMGLQRGPTGNSQGILTWHWPGQLLARQGHPSAPLPGSPGQVIRRPTCSQQTWLEASKTGRSPASAHRQAPSSASRLHDPKVGSTRSIQTKFVINSPPAYLPTTNAPDEPLHIHTQG